jgi:RNA polymerase sigma-70 factor (ECF subfamily)
MENILFINTTEEALIERLCNNDELAQRELFDRYEKNHLRSVFAIINNEEEALDAFNRSFLKIVEKIHQFKSEAKFETWLHRITINTCFSTSI